MATAESQRRHFAQSLVTHFTDFRKMNGKDKEGQRLHHLFFLFLHMYEQHTVGVHLAPTEAMAYSTVLDGSKFGRDIRIAEERGWVIRQPNPDYPNSTRRYVLAPGDKLLDFFDERLEELRTVGQDSPVPSLV